MALDSEDIKKLDEHIVEPLLQAVEGLGDRIDGLGERFDALGERFDALGERIDDFGGRIERSNAELVREIVTSNETLRQSTHRAVERVIQLSERILERDRVADAERDTLVNERLKALEVWKTELEKKGNRN